MEKKLKSPKMVFLRYPLALSCYFLFYKVSKYTMVTYEALYQMKQLIDDVDRKGIKGAIVETGCWNGGCGAFMAYVSKKNGSNRPTWLFDSFEGLPEPLEQDAFIAKKVNLPMDSLASYLATPIENAQAIVKKMGVESIVRIIKGWFHESIPQQKELIGSIAVLRLDGDFYESTKVVLEQLYDSISPGGYVVIDDFAFPGCRMAIYDFFSEKGISPSLKDGGKYQRAFFQKEE